MPRLKRLSGDEVVAALGHYGFHVHQQRGSHVKLRRTVPAGNRETLTIPRQACRFVPEGELRTHIYAE